MSAELTNSVTGETVLSDGDGRSYALVFDLSAAMKIEQATSRGMLDIITGRPTISETVVALIHGSAAWCAAHPGQGRPITPASALRVLRDCGGYAVVAPAVLVSMAMAEGLGLRDDAVDGAKEDDAGPPGHGPEQFGPPLRSASILTASGD